MGMLAQDTVLIDEIEGHRPRSTVPTWPCSSDNALSRRMPQEDLAQLARSGGQLHADGEPAPGGVANDDLAILRRRVEHSLTDVLVVDFDEQLIIEIEGDAAAAAGLKLVEYGCQVLSVAREVPTCRSSAPSQAFENNHVTPRRLQLPGVSRIALNLIRDDRGHPDHRGNR